MYLLFDIGGTKTRLATASGAGGIEAKVKFETPRSFEEGVARFVEEARKLLDGRELTGVAGGIRGVLSPDRGSIEHESVLTDWVGKPLTARLSEQLNIPVYLENDAAIGALGEAVYGSGKGHPIVAYHTVSTGVGGARVVNGMIDESHNGFEPGKQVVDVDHTTGAPFGGHGTLEELISGESLERRTGKKPYETPQESPIWDELAGYLAHGLKNTIVYWSPDIVVLGGSMIIGNPRILLADIVRHTAEVMGELSCPPIVDATLGDDCGLFGALALLESRQKVTS